jgi:hypothetical protein
VYRGFAPRLDLICIRGQIQTSMYEQVVAVWLPLSSYDLHR